MHANNCCHVRARACELKYVSAPKAEAGCSLSTEIANAACVALAAKRVERRCNAASAFRCIRAQAVGEGCSLRRTVGDFAAAIHIGNERDVFGAGHVADTLDSGPADAKPVR